MAETRLNTLVIEPAGETRAAIIWMHGLGANAHDFEPIVPHLKIPPEAGLKFIFPDAPVRPVTINGGMRMQAWYDILSADLARVEDEASVRDSAAALSALVDEQLQLGLAPGSVLLAGFSQGGAMALHVGLRYPKPLGGILALSCYLPLLTRLDEERDPANQQVPIMMAHGTFDPVVPLQLGTASRDKLLSLGYTVDWREYPMQHEVNLDEINDIGAWLGRRLRDRVG